MYSRICGKQKIIIPAKDMVVIGNMVLGHGYVIFRPETVEECDAFIARWAAREDYQNNMINEEEYKTVCLRYKRN